MQNNNEKNLKCDATAYISTNPDPLEACGPLTVNLTCNVTSTLDPTSYYWERTDYCDMVTQTWTTSTNTLTDQISDLYEYCDRGIYHYRCTVTFTDSSTITSDWITATSISDKPVCYIRISQPYVIDQVTNVYETPVRPELYLRLNYNITLDLSDSIPDCDQTSIRYYSYEWYGDPADSFVDPDYTLGTWQSSPTFIFRKVNNNYGPVCLLVKIKSWDGAIGQYVFWGVHRY